MPFGVREHPEPAARRFDAAGGPAPTAFRRRRVARHEVEFPVLAVFGLIDEVVEQDMDRGDVRKYAANRRVDRARASRELRCVTR